MMTTKQQFISHATVLVGAFFVSIGLCAIPHASLAWTIEDLRPDDPSNVEITNRGPYAATITWDEEELATDYELRLYRTGGKDIAIKDDIKTESFRIKKKRDWLKPNRQYYVRVAAINDDLGSGAADADKIYFRTKPTKPQNVQVVSAKKKKANLRWTKPEGTIRFYYVQVREYKNGELTRKWRKKVKTEAELVEYTLGDLKKNRSYKVRVKAGFNNKNISKYTNWKTIAPR